MALYPKLGGAGIGSRVHIGLNPPDTSEVDNGELYYDLTNKMMFMYTDNSNNEVLNLPTTSGIWLSLYKHSVFIDRLAIKNGMIFNLHTINGNNFGIFDKFKKNPSPASYVRSYRMFVYYIKFKFNNLDSGTIPNGNKINVIWDRIGGYISNDFNIVVNSDNIYEYDLGYDYNYSEDSDNIKHIEVILNTNGSSSSFKSVLNHGIIIFGYGIEVDK